MRRTHGYGGYYNGVYLRSSLEFAYAYYLNYYKIDWDYECEVYSLLDGTTYKPDFYIKEGEKIIKIVEIKGDARSNGKSGKRKIELYMEQYDTPIEMIGYKEILKIYQTEMPIRYHKAKSMWVEEYGAKLQVDVSGEKNPRFKAVVSEETKLKISQKAKQRFQDKEYKERLVKRLVEYNRKTGFASAKRLRSKRVEKKCENPKCNNVMTLTEAEAKRTKYCSTQCNLVSISSLGNEAQSKNRNQIRQQAKEFMIDWVKQNRELVLVTQYNKITTTLEELFKEVEVRFGIKDMRIISRSMFGEDRGRKALLEEFKRIAATT
ncbi:hypothetical protein V7128_05845 [Neobacillus vireti]|uniref:hypothetical protein n=1 Tax=Neobacillus vireti TaxID=220686 RepID=UPI002FFD793F